MRGMGPPVSSLLAVQLDDELLGHGDLDVVAERQAAHGPLLLVGVDLQPLGYLAAARVQVVVQARHELRDRKSTRLNSSHGYISYAVFCLKKKKKKKKIHLSISMHCICVQHVST